MVAYDIRQWEKCKWDLSTLSDKQSCIEKIPALRERFRIIEAAYYKTPEIPVPLEKIIRYVVLVYHRFSPYAVHQQDIVARKFDVCEFVGLNIKDKDVKKMIANQIPFVNNAALYFLKTEANMAWLELQVYLEAYYQIMGALMDGTTDSDKASKDPVGNAKTKQAVVKDMKNIKSEIDLLSVQIFSGESDLLNHIERFKEAEANDFLVYSPEDFVRKIAKA